MSTPAPDSTSTNSTSAESPTPTNAWTTRRLLAWMNEAFAGKGIDSPRVCAEMLLTHVTGQQRLALYTAPDRPASDTELAALRQLVSRALRHEPVQYLTNEAAFFGHRLFVDRRVLIPRPCTELLVEHAVQHITRAAMNAQGHVVGGLGESLARQAELAPSETPAGASIDDEDLSEEERTKREIARNRSELLKARAGRSQRGRGVLIADVCTGSGCMAIALAKALPGAHVIATDISPDALQVASENAQRLGVSECITFIEGSLLEPVVDALQSLQDPARASAAGFSRPPTGFDVIVSNPPYIPDHEWTGGLVDDNVKLHEPTLALRGGTDGLAFVAPILQDAPALLKPAGLLLIEIAACTANAVADAARQHTLLESTTANVVRDLEGFERMLKATRRGS
jgi:release factor glutamine methyltransferase